METDPKTDISVLTRAAERQRSPELGDDLRDAINELMDQPKEARSLLIQAVCEILPSISSGHGAGTLAVWLGAMVENGRDPSLSFKAVKNTWLRWARLIQVDDQAKGSTAPEPAFHAVDDCARSLVSHCSKSEELRQKLIHDGRFVTEVSRLSSDSTGAMWLEQLVQQTSGELLVLNMELGAGALVRYDHISNCFHLFTLLQCTLSHWLPPSKRPAQQVLQSAKGESSDPVNDEASWHYQQPMSDAPDIAQSMWGEANPKDVQSIDSQQVLVLWPMILKGRSWDAGFFGPLLNQRRPSVEIVRELSQADFELWKAKLPQIDAADKPTLPAKAAETTPAETKSPWWQFWRR